MLNFLRQSRKFIKSKEPVCIVLGNESCDLDSAVCAVSLAYFYQKTKNCKLSNNTNVCNFLPILNIPRRDYPLKTEVQYIFQQHSITSDMLTFLDELTEEFLKNNPLVLVDHHVSIWSSQAVAVYDHRPKDLTAVLPDSCELNLHLVGSCATLIAELYLNHNIMESEVKDILELLRSTIVLDTINFSKDAARATPRDSNICSALENKLKTFSALNTREQLFDELVKARSDISSLTTAELLRKDLKILTSTKDANLKMAIPGFPLPVQQFILKSNSAKSLTQFALENNCAVILLMGMFVNPEDSSVSRDLGLIDINNPVLYQTIKNCLESLDDPKLSLEIYHDCKFANGTFYKQGNIKATRKHILPVVKNLLDSC